MRANRRVQVKVIYRERMIPKKKKKIGIISAKPTANGSPMRIENLEDFLILKLGLLKCT